MAKALFGHVGGADLRLVDEVRRLRRKVNELEGEVVRLQSERDVLTAVVLEHHLPPAPLTVPPDLAELTDVAALR